MRERAIEGAANDACVKALAEALAVAPSHVELIRGHRGRIKTFSVKALDDGQIAARLAAHLD